MVSHLRRDRVPRGRPLHVTVRLLPGLPSLRRPRTHAVLLDVFAKGCDRFGMRMTHFSILSNHIHMIVEAKDRAAVSRGMKGLKVRIARALNRLWRRRGTVFADRYHDRVLHTARAVRRALCYVLNNALRHGVRCRGADPFSSWPWFWTAYGGSGPSGSPPVAAPRGQLLRADWQLYGLLDPTEIPGRFALC